MRTEEGNNRGRRGKNEEVGKKRMRQNWERREEKSKGNIFKGEMGGYKCKLGTEEKIGEERSGRVAPQHTPRPAAARALPPEVIDHPGAGWTRGCLQRHGTLVSETSTCSQKQGIRRRPGDRREMFVQNMASRQ